VPSNPVNGGPKIIVSVFLFLFNLTGLRFYPSHYDRLLIVVRLVFNILAVWYPFTWVWV
jgi:hypothetical protein